MSGKALAAGITANPDDQEPVASAIPLTISTLDKALGPPPHTSEDRPLGDKKHTAHDPKYDQIGQRVQMV